ncbi:MAG: NAD(P)/FAD-dependent oxidoreductase [Phenylobacterium sp.]|uniref:NAD(P)/FAD-dependent oxidoreductase n=1 Tax=Phenylobacterium sp. TaxID=1871053 RepID=UPI0008BF94AB|nr:MAG: hypothetical protein A2882_15790 [Phenylobacterium sp. RIFCSPHIGHO2_01_FULL_70_10]
MTQGLRVAIVGEGVFGLACALELAKSGAQVSVHDPKRPLEQNASRVAAGMIAPVSEALTDESARPHVDLLLAAGALWPAFAAENGLDLDRTGTLLLGDEARLAGLETALSALGRSSHRLGPSELPDFPLGFAAGLGALAIAEDWRIDSSALLSMAVVAEDLGVVFNTAPPDLQTIDRLVVATGWSPSSVKLAPELKVLSPIKGHILSLPYLDYTGPALRGPGAYAVPSDLGPLIGATMEVGRGEGTVDAAVARDFAARAAAVFPRLADRPWIAAAGVRAATPDGLPMVGESAADGVILATGARRNGWLLAPMVGRMVADVVLGYDPGPWAKRLDPRRFDA